MDPGHGHSDDFPAGPHRRSINHNNLPSTHHSPTEARQSTFLQPEHVQVEQLPLCDIAGATTSSRVSSTGSLGGNVYRYRGPSNHSCNLNEGSYPHRPPTGPNHEFHHGGLPNASFNPRLFGVGRPQISNNLQGNLYGQEHGDVSANEITEGLRSHLANAGFPTEDIECGNVYSYRSPSNHPFNLDEGSYRHRPPTGPNHEFHHGGLPTASFNPTLFGVGRPQISNNLQGNLYGQEHGYAFANETTEGLGIHLENTGFPITENIESNSQHYPTFLENPSNTFNRSSAEESAVTSMLNTHPLYSMNDVPSAVTNQSSFNNLPSYSSSLGEGHFGQSQFIAEQYYGCQSSHLFADSTQEVSTCFAVSSLDHYSTTNIVTNQPWSSNLSSYSTSSGESHFEQSQFIAEQIFPSFSISADIIRDVDGIERLELSGSVHYSTTNFVTNEVSSYSSSNPVLLGNRESYINMEQYSYFVTSSSYLPANTAQEILPPMNRYEENNAMRTPRQEMPWFMHLPPSYNTPASTSTSQNMIGENSAIAQGSTALDEYQGFPNIPPSTERLTTKKKQICNFCRKSRSPVVFRSHKLRDEKGDVVCPFLRNCVCDICGATGSKAHTSKYCPQKTYEDLIKKMEKL